MTPHRPSLGRPGRADVARSRAARRRRRPPLGLEAIVDEALRLIDTEGVDAVSMRRVAAEFDTGPASLYAYVASKDELLRLTLERAIGEMTVPEGDDWQDVVRTWAHESHAVLARHNDIARLTFGTIPTGPNMMEATERLLASMIEGGVPAKVATWALDVLSLYVAADAYEGWLSTQIFHDGSGRSPEEVGREYVATVTASFAELPAERFPHLIGNLELMMSGGGEERFAFGVDMLIAGFAAQVPPGRPRKGRSATRRRPTST